MASSVRGAISARSGQPRATLMRASRPAVAGARCSPNGRWLHRQAASIQRRSASATVQCMTLRKYPKILAIPAQLERATSGSTDHYSVFRGSLTVLRRCALTLSHGLHFRAWPFTATRRQSPARRPCCDLVVTSWARKTTRRARSEGAGTGERRRVLADATRQQPILSPPAHQAASESDQRNRYVGVPAAQPDEASDAQANDREHAHDRMIGDDAGGDDGDERGEDREGNGSWFMASAQRRLAGARCPPRSPT